MQTAIPASMRILQLILVLALLFPHVGPDAYGQREYVSPEEAFAQAHRYYGNQLYEQAVQHFASFRSRYPDHPNAGEALYYQAVSSLALHRDEAAVELLSEFQQDYPFHPLAFQARLALGKYFFETGEYDRSIETFERVLSDNPPSSLAAKALYWMGDAALRMGDADRALGFFERAADTHRDTETAPGALYAMAYAQIEQGQHGDAARSLEVLAARYPDSQIAQNVGLALAEVYYELEDYGRVVSEISRRLPNLSGEAQERATFLLAEAYNHLRDSENAIVYYRRFTEGNPGSPYYRRALYGLAWNYYFNGSNQWAAEHFEQVRRGHDDALAQRATYYEAVNRRIINQSTTAAQLFEEFARRWPRHELADHALHELGLTYYDQRLWREANEVFERAIETYPRSGLRGELLYMLGGTQIALGDFDAAFRSFDHAIDLDAAPPALREQVEFQKAWLLYRNGRYAEAAPAFIGLYTSNTQGPYAADATFWAAESQYQNGELGEAETYFKRYLADYRGGKHQEAAHYALGWVHFKQGRYREAVSEFTTFLDSYRASGEIPYRTDALLRLADSYYALKRYPEAINHYARVAQEGESYALYQMGQAYSNMGDAYQAITTFRSLLSEHPDSEFRDETEFQLAYLYFLNQDYDQAIDAYGSLIERVPRSPLAAKAQYSIGDALYNAGRLEEAVDAYRRVLDRYGSSPFAPEAAASIHYALINMNDERRADAIIDDFIARNPNSPIIDDLRFRRAEVKYQSGRHQAALRELTEFVGQTRNASLRADAQYYIGLIEAEQNRTEQAEAMLRQVVESGARSSRAIDAARRLGDLYVGSNRPQEALQMYERLERLNPSDPRIVAEARYGQAEAYLQMGRTREAEGLLQEALQGSADGPGSARVRLGMARVRERSGQPDEAASMYRQVVDESNDEAGAEALFRLGVLLLNRNQPSAAIEELSRMSVLYSGYPRWEAQAYLTQARAFHRLGQNGEAARLYDRVIREFGDTQYARTAATEKQAL